MAAEKISALASLGTAPAATDLLVLVDVSDTTMAPTGTTKNMTVADLESYISAWKLNGNTVGAEKWIGTIDNYALPFRINNVEVGRFGTNGYLGIGINPTLPLHVSFDVNNFTGIAGVNSSTGTSAVSALFATNNTGKNVALGIGGGNTTAYQNDYCNANEGFMALSTSVAGFRFFGSLGGAKSWRFYSSLQPTANPNFVVHSSGNIGFNIETPTALIHAVGGGSTSATYTAKFQNSSSAAIFDLRDDGVSIFGGAAKLKSYTVATLPAGEVGMIAYVTDALLPTFLVTIAGGGAVTTPVFYNGSNWVAF